MEFQRRLSKRAIVLNDDSSKMDSFSVFSVESEKKMGREEEKKDFFPLIQNIQENWLKKSIKICESKDF
jgi:hypothetical protein